MGVWLLFSLLGMSATFVPETLPPAAGWSPAIPTAVGSLHSTARPAKGRFLVASRNLSDPNFSHSVVLLLAHEARGSMGVVINRPTSLRLATLLPDLRELRDRTDHVSFGGPVAINAITLLLRTRHPPRKAEPVFGDVYATGDLDNLREALVAKGERADVRAYVGYAGWGAGQLEQEIARGDWYVGPADAGSVFDPSPTEIWDRLIDRFSGAWTRTSPGVAPLPPPRS